MELIINGKRRQNRGLAEDVFHNTSSIKERHDVKCI
jgi:hypothetical protein